MKHHKLQEILKDPNYALELGRASEHLVVSDLIVQGFRAFLSDQGLPYDVVVDIAGRLLRVQVKAACFMKNVNMKGRRSRMAYSWNVRKRGKGGSQRLHDGMCDIVALVALDARRIAYVPVSACGETVQLPLERGNGQFGYAVSELESFQDALNGRPVSLATKGRRVAIHRNGQMTLRTVGLDY